MTGERLELAPEIELVVEWEERRRIGGVCSIIDGSISMKDEWPSRTMPFVRRYPSTSFESNQTPPKPIESSSCSTVASFAWSFCHWRSKRPKCPDWREDVQRVYGIALLVAVREVRTGASDVEKWHVHVLKAFAGFAPEQLLETGKQAPPVCKRESEAEGTLDVFLVKIWVGEDAEGAL